MTRKKLILVAAVLVLAVIGGWWIWSPYQPEQATYREYTAERGDLEVSILSTGIVQPKNRLEIKPPLAGRAEEVRVQEGARVKKGQVLAWMSSLERAALLDAARAKGEAEVRRWEEFYRATPIISPIDGTVILRQVEPGQTFTNVDAVLVIADRLIIEAQVDETDIGKVELNQKARIVLDAYPDEQIPAHVDAIAYEAKTVSNVTTYIVDVIPERTPAHMRSGMTANVSFVLAKKKDVLLLPAHAVRSQEGKSHVLVRAANGKPVKRSVRTGLSDGKQVEILEGVVAGDKVLVARVKLGNKNAGGFNPFSIIRQRSKR